jgi:dienelactone hydrolase
MAEKKDPAYFMYFPGNYRWSAAFINMLGSIAYGGAEIGELHKIGTLLKGKAPEDDAAWFDACARVADGVTAYARKWDEAGHRYAAAHAYLRACNYYQMAERFRTPKDAVALDVYRRGVDCFHRHVALTDLEIEIVEVPYENGSLPGYFVHALNPRSKRAPCVVFFDGLDVTKEIQFVRGVPDLVKRGISCLVMDGPGTGEAIRFRGYVLRHDYEAAGSACVDYLEQRKDVDPKRIGVVAISLGGYYAPRCAAMEPRFAACIAWGAQWDYHATWKKRIDASFKTSLSVPGHHIMWILGVDSLDAALTALEPYRLEGVMRKMRCPFLLVHGADDEQIPLEDAKKQFDACGSRDKTLRVYTAEEGGAQHCQRDYLTLVVADMWNWFDEKLNR